jgi:DNA-binding HxlR family transcriptional regulator
MISGKYKLRILWGLREGAKRYGDIRTGLLSGGEGSKEIAARVLSRELKQLAEMGMIARKDFRLVPPKVEYSLTATGESFIPVVAEIRHWGERHLAKSSPSAKRETKAA